MEKCFELPKPNLQEEWYSIVSFFYAPVHNILDNFIMFWGIKENMIFG
jgi:hypothetical protein